VHQIVAPFGRALALPHERLQFDQSSSFNVAYGDKSAISGAHLLSVAFDYVSDGIQFQKSNKKLVMKAANCQIRARRHAAPNGKTRPRSLVLGDQGEVIEEGWNRRSAGK
jgi:hypothetical protein